MKYFFYVIAVLVQSKNSAEYEKKKKEAKPFEQNFINSLFVGKCDKDILKFPFVLSSSDIERVLVRNKEVDNLVSFTDSPLNISSTLGNLKKLKLFGLSVPEKYGGLDYSTTEIQYLLETLNSNPQLGHFIGYQNFCCEILNSLGNEHQKLKYLSKMTSGDCLGSLAYLENSSLMGLNSMQTTLVFDKKLGSYMLNGSKNLVCNANVADVIIVLSKVIKESHEKNLQNQYHFCLIDKNAPGVKINDLKNYTDFYLHQIEFENVKVTEENIIGDPKINIFPALKMALSLNHLNASVACLSLLKSLLKSASTYINDNTLDATTLKSHSFIQDKIRYLSMYIYIVESLTYLVAGRFDEFEAPDLFLETSAAKSLAIEFLQSGITAYSQIVGSDSCTLPSLLLNASKALCFYSGIDENQTHLKLVIGSIGLTQAAKSSESLRKTVMILRKPYNYFIEYYKYKMGPKHSTLKSNEIRALKESIHKELKNEANILEECFSLMNMTIKNIFIKFGSDAIKEENHIILLGQMAVYIFALTASISRAISFDQKRLPEHEINMIKIFATKVHLYVNDLAYDIKLNVDFSSNYKYIGQAAFNKKQYPLCHPLFRSY